MSKTIKIPEPEKELEFIDVHCHLPFPRPRNDKLPSDEKQYKKFFEMGGKYLITCSIDILTLKLILNFIKNKENIGFTCGWAPQTVTYTPKDKYEKEWKEWEEYVKKNPDQFLAIGEIGLDFHHAKMTEKRNRQIEELRKIFELTKDLDKPYVLHVRNAATHEFDRQNPKHRYNQKDGANKEILNILQEYNIKSENVMWHCFSGPDNYGLLLGHKGYILSVPSSAYSNKRWRNATKNVPLKSLVTETDSYYQHPYLRGPVNVPSNVRYTIAALAYSHNTSQKIISEKTIKNANKFYRLEID